MARQTTTILGIETSCDETAASAISITDAPTNYESKRITNIQILSNIVSSQVKIHAKYGGIVPEVAARKHAENIIFVLQQALKSKILNQSTKQSFLLGRAHKDMCSGLKSVDAIAVTNGPGLITSLLIGVEAAKTLAFLAKKPLISVNHLAGHIYANFLDMSYDTCSMIHDLFPAICLIVSGGHTELVLMRNFENFKKIGQTLDDAAGECFDKTAKILGLSYPGGPEIARQAAQFNHKPLTFSLKLPRPMINSPDFNFSFSGLKTAILYKTRELGNSQTHKHVPEICAEAQQAIIDVLISKTIKAAQKFGAKSIILGGGVVANQELRRQFAEKVKREIPNSLFLIPNSNLCTDNAAMVAVAGYFKLSKTPKKDWLKKFDWQKIKADPNLEI